MESRFSRTARVYGPEAVTKLAARRVAVFGLGGVGGYAVEALARSGIGAAWDGRVTAVRDTMDGFSARESAGNYVIIDHGGGVVTKYYHLERGTAAVAAGERVYAGQYIGMMGASGYVTGAHLHFQLEIDGVPVDPAPYIERPGEEAERMPAGGTDADEAGGAEEASEWAAEAVAWAQDRGIIWGDGEGNLLLREPCTREMALVFLWRALGGMA